MMQSGAVPSCHRKSLPIIIRVSMNIAITSKTIQNAHYIFAKQTPITISNADSKLYGLKGSSWSNIVLWNDRQLFFYYRELTKISNNNNDNIIIAKTSQQQSFKWFSRISSVTEYLPLILCSL